MTDAIDATARFVIRTHDPHRGVAVYWVGNGWSPYIEDAAEFKTRNGATDLSEKIARPSGSPLPFVDLLEPTTQLAEQAARQR